MESPPSGSTWLEAFPASDDSGLLLTSGSISSSSGEGCHCTLAMELQDSDDDGKSLSREGSLDYSDGMSCENFNTLKKGPGWPEFYSFENSCDGKLVPIDPPPEFQDSPPLSEVYQTVPAKNILVGPCRPLSAKSISRVSPASERRYIDKFSGKLVASILAEALSISCKVTWSIHCSQDCHPLECELGKFSQQSASSPRLCWTPELPLVPRTCPGSRASPASPLSRGRPSPPPHQPRRSDSTPGEIGDVYNVPFDSDVYAVPVDVVRPTADATTTTSSRKASSSTQQTLQQPQRPGRRHLRKRRRHPSAAGSRSEATTGTTRGRGSTATLGQPQQQQSVATATESGGKRHSVPQSTTSPDPPAPANGASSGLGGRCCPTAGSSRTSARTKGGHRGASNEGRSSEPIHMTLQEVRQYLRNLYSGGGCGRVRGRGGENDGEAEEGGGGGKGGRHKSGGTAAAPQSAAIVSNGKAAMLGAEGSSRETSGRSSSSSRHGGFSTNLRQTLCSIFRLRRVPASPGGGRRHATTARRPIPTPPESAVSSSALEDQVEQQQPSSEVPPPPFTGRALPPLPPSTRPPAPLPDETSPLSPPPLEEGDKGEDGAAGDQSVTEEPSMDFASSIEKVKDYGWYWGPISGEAAEKILFNEPDGSFIVRDSSDDHYIFSLTFKLNGCVRHVRIEHDQGNFSFGCCTKFKSHTIVDFIENAVEHSRSGRYLFFLHRRPVLGPMRVQLLHPVSRFKQVQSLQHMCRFVILKVVRRDLIQTLPLPRRIIDYLSTPHYYSEQTLEEERSGSSGAGSPGGGTRGGGSSLQQTPPPPPLSRPPEIPPEDDTPPS